MKKDTNKNKNRLRFEWYEHPLIIFISIILALIFLALKSYPFFVFLLMDALIFTIISSIKIAQVEKVLKKYNNVEDIEEEIKNLQSQKEKKITDVKDSFSDEKRKYDLKLETLQKEKESINEELKKLKSEVQSLESNSLVENYNFSSYEALSSQECKNKLALINQEIKDLIKDKKIFKVSGEWTKKEIQDNQKQIIRCFNAECDNILVNLTPSNIDSSRRKMVSSFESLNKIFSVDGIEINKKLLSLKLEALNLVHTFAIKKEQEKEIQKAIKEQMMDEQKAERELENEKRKIEKDEAQHNNEIKRMMKYLQNTESDVEKQLYIDKIADLEKKIKELQEKKESVEFRQATATAGYVYVISNIGSFGDDIYKIGMTRRLEPMDRVNELSSASVPFIFDVHAMIFSENAPELETKLHEAFRDRSVNKVNFRKEFFNVSIDEIEKVVKENFSDTVEFTKVPVASEYRESLRLSGMNEQ